MDTVSLVIETENLKGGAGHGDEVASLERLLTHLRGQSFGLERLRELVVTHEGMNEQSVMRLEKAAGRRILFVEIPKDAGYYGGKDLGFDRTTGDVVVFGDADCWPAPNWLSAITAPFESEAVQVVAGRTAYREGVLGEALTTIDFLYFDSPLGDGCTRNFYANNVAFRREVFGKFRYGEQRGFYRGTCQVLGTRLLEAGIAVQYVHEALTTHRLPDTFAEYARLRMLRGGDLVTLSPFIARTALPKPAQPVAKVPGLMPVAVLAGRLLFSVLAGARERKPFVKQAAVTAVTVAASGMDAIGAAAKSAGLLRGVEREVLSYHSNRDGLRSAA
ncbi:MAG: glycosyltransferase [Myxococcaceae bacterium]